MTTTANLRDRLLDHAITMLESGEAEPGIRALARATGVSAMAPYRHFADKTALLGAVAERGSTMLAAELATADAKGSDAARLVEQGLAYVAFARAHPALFRLMFARTCAAPIPPDTATFTILTRRVEAVAGGAAPDAALGCWAIVHGLATLALDAGVAMAPEQLRTILSLYVAGIATRPT